MDNGTERGTRMLVMVEVVAVTVPFAYRQNLLRADDVGETVKTLRAHI